MDIRYFMQYFISGCRLVDGMATFVGSDPDGDPFKRFSTPKSIQIRTTSHHVIDKRKRHLGEFYRRPQLLNKIP